MNIPRRHVTRVMILSGNTLTLLGVTALCAAFLGVLPMEAFASGLSSGVRIVAMVPLSGCLLSAFGYGINEFFD